MMGVGAGMTATARVRGNGVGVCLHGNDVDGAWMDSRLRGNDGDVGGNDGDRGRYDGRGIWGMGANGGDRSNGGGLRSCA